MYAAFTQNLTINGTATGRSSSWKIYFSRLTGPTLNGTTKQITAPMIQNNATKIGDYEVTVTSPGDYIEYEFDVTNDGDYDATLLPKADVAISGLGIQLTYTQDGNAKVNANGTTPYVDHIVIM